MANRYPPKRKGQPRRLNYDDIKARLEAGERNCDIARDVECSSHHIGRLKKTLGLLPDRWESVPEWY